VKQAALKLSATDADTFMLFVPPSEQLSEWSFIQS
jgi:hypothetical protein